MASKGVLAAGVGACLSGGAVSGDEGQVYNQIFIWRRQYNQRGDRVTKGDGVISGRHAVGGVNNVGDGMGGGNGKADRQAALVGDIGRNPGHRRLYPGSRGRIPIQSISKSGNQFMIMGKKICGGQFHETSASTLQKVSRHVGSAIACLAMRNQAVPATLGALAKSLISSPG